VRGPAAEVAERFGRLATTSPAGHRPQNPGAGSAKTGARAPASAGQARPRAHDRCARERAREPTSWPQPRGQTFHGADGHRKPPHPVGAPTGSLEWSFASAPRHHRRTLGQPPTGCTVINIPHPRGGANWRLEPRPQPVLRIAGPRTPPAGPPRVEPSSREPPARIEPNAPAEHPIPWRLTRSAASPQPSAHARTTARQFARPGTPPSPRRRSAPSRESRASGLHTRRWVNRRPRPLWDLS